MTVATQPRFVMTVETWMSLTEVRFKPRDHYLKAVDEALKEWHKTKSGNALGVLRIGVHNWKMSKGFDGAGKPGWVSDDRNFRKGVERLDLQIYGQQGDLSNSAALSMMAELPFYGVEAWADDSEARQILKEARQQSIHAMFAGKEVILSRSGMAKTIASIVTSLGELALDARKLEHGMKKDGVLGGGSLPGSKWSLPNVGRAPFEAAKTTAQNATTAVSHEAKEFVNKAVNAVLSLYPEVAKEAFDYVSSEIPGWLLEVASAMMPYFGVVKNAQGAASDLYTAAKLQIVKLWQRQHIPAFGSGDPNAAVMALRQVMDREIALNLIESAIASAEGTVKALGHTLDAASLGIPSASVIMTPLAGLTGGIAKLLVKLAYLARDFSEKRKANLLLQNAASIKIDAHLFEVCPVVGCIWLANANLSDLVNFLIEDIGAPEWQSDIEAMNKKHIQPMLGRAREVMNSSRIQVAGLEYAKGAHKPIDGGVLGAISVGPLSGAQVFVRKNIIMKFKAKLPAKTPVAIGGQNYQQVAAQQGFKPVSPAQLAQKTKVGMGPNGPWQR